MNDQLLGVVAAPFVQHQAKPSEDLVTIQDHIPTIFRKSGFDLSEKKVKQEILQLVRLCDLYTEDQKDWANHCEVIKQVFYHFCGCKTLYELLPPLDVDDVKSDAILNDDRSALRLRIRGENVGVKINCDVLYFSPEGHLMTKFSTADPQILIRQGHPPRFNVDINRYLSLHHRLFGHTEHT